jgi:hypothetical protein
MVTESGGVAAVTTTEPLRLDPLRSIDTKEDMTTTDYTEGLTESAIGYARKGWPVFRLQPGKKEPLRGGRGFKDATASVAGVVDWWTENPAYNIGFAISADIVVLDVDPRNQGLVSLAKLEAEYGYLDVTLCAASGRGDGGLHYYYRRPDADLVGGLSGLGYPGIDLKKEGGYVLLPPSVHPDTGRMYRWVNDDTANIVAMPAWLVKLATRPPREAPETPAQTGTVIDRLDMADPARWNGSGLVARLAGAKAGERNNMLNWALWQLRDDLVSGKTTEQLFEYCLANIIDTAGEIGLDDREIQGTIRSVFRPGDNT